MNHLMLISPLVAIAASLFFPNKTEAQYFFERSSDSYVRIDDSARAETIALQIEIDPNTTISDEDDFDSDTPTSGDQSSVAASAATASASTHVSSVTSFTNSEMTFNPDNIANGQVSALVISGAMATIGGSYPAFGVTFQTNSIFGGPRATTEAKFTLKNNASTPPSTQVKLKIKQSSSYTSDPAFNWTPEHYFEIFKNNNGSPPNTPVLSSSAQGEVTFIDPAAYPNDYYVIKGIVRAGGGLYYGILDPPVSSSINYLGSMHVIGEAEVSLVP